MTKEWITEYPTVCCKETYNPAGKTIPPAGSTTMPGPKGGINDDGFYELDLIFPENFNNNIDNSKYGILVIDCGSGTEFGPFEDGTRIKYTEANGANPSIKSMTGENSKADAVDFHIKGKGDMCLKLVILNGENNGYTVVDGCGCCCPVPPPPK